MRALILRLTLPLLILLALELAFRAGAWERMTPQNSHAGKAARVTRGLQTWPGNIDFVTIGDSRAKYGFDHQLIADTATRHGQTHASLAIPGAHFLVETLILKWLGSEHPELQGGVFATSIPALLSTHNGDYELATAQPFSKTFKREEILLNRFESEKVATWGAVSSLYQYREDIQDFLKYPVSRLQSMLTEEFSSESQLFDSSTIAADVCEMDISSLASCISYSGDDTHYLRVVDQCKRYLSRVKTARYRDRYVRDPLSPTQQTIFEARQAQFESIRWPIPPVVVLMPVSLLWFQEMAPEGAEEWAHSILDPLVEEGKIHLLDYSHFFDTESGSRCETYSDPMHQSRLGVEELTADLLPKLQQWLYSSPKRHQ